MCPERKDNRRLSARIKTHIETIIFFPAPIVIGLFRNPREAIKLLNEEGLKPTYRALYFDLASKSLNKPTTQ